MCASQIQRRLVTRVEVEPTVKIMRDQAEQLRSLISEVTRESNSTSAHPCNTIVFCGAKHGVGTSTLALNLAMSFQLHGRQTVLVDADAEGGDLQAFAGTRAVDSLADVLAGKRSLAEAMVSGPVGIKICSGGQIDPNAIHRLPGILQSIEQATVIVDAGTGWNDVAQAFVGQSKNVVVTATDSASIMDAYVILKLGSKQGFPNCPDIVINKTIDAASSESASRRLSESCERFLGVTIQIKGSVPLDSGLVQSTDGRQSMRRGSAAELAILQLRERFEIEPRAMMANAQVGIQKLGEEKLNKRLDHTDTSEQCRYATTR